MFFVRPSRRFLALTLCFLLSTFQARGDGKEIEKSEFSFPATGVRVEGQAILLAIDEVSLPLKNNLCYYLSKPTVRKEAVLMPSRDNPNAPDYLAAHFYGTVLHDQGKFRMWYYPVSYGETSKDVVQGPVCYAESEDGIRWRKPVLNQMEFKGSKKNNAIRLPESKIEGVNVLKDTSDPDPSRRYKMVYNPFHGGKFTIQTATSPDGIHWTPRKDYPKDQFLEQSSFFKHNGLYLIHGQSLEVGEGGGARGRQGYAWVSADFNHWLQATAEAFALPEPADPSERGLLKPYDQVHLGVGGASFGNVAVGLYGLWHNFPGDQSRDVPESWFAHEKISGDLGLVVSNDGIHFREPVKGHVYLSRGDSPVTASDGTAHPTILIQSSGILNVGDETRIYHGRWRNAMLGKNYWGEVALATLPRDRWGALGLYPKQTEGEVWTTPITLPKTGCQIVLNAEGANAMRVEIANDRFELFPEFSGDKSGASNEQGGLDCSVTWPEGDLDSLGGKTVRLRISMKRTDKSKPRLYAVYLREASSEHNRDTVLQSGTTPAEDSRLSIEPLLMEPGKTDRMGGANLPVELVEDEKLLVEKNADLPVILIRSKDYPSAVWTLRLPEMGILGTEGRTGYQTKYHWEQDGPNAYSFDWHSITGSRLARGALPGKVRSRVFVQDDRRVKFEVHYKNESDEKWVMPMVWVCLIHKYAGPGESFFWSDDSLQPTSSIPDPKDIWLKLFTVQGHEAFTAAHQEWDDYTIRPGLATKPELVWQSNDHEGFEVRIGSDQAGLLGWSKWPCTDMGLVVDEIGPGKEVTYSGYVTLGFNKDKR